MSEVIISRYRMMDKHGGVIAKIKLCKEDENTFSIRVQYTAQIAKAESKDLNHLVSDKVFNFRTGKIESLENFYEECPATWIDDNAFAQLSGMELPFYYYSDATLLGLPDLVREYDNEMNRIYEIAKKYHFIVV